MTTSRTNEEILADGCGCGGRCNKHDHEEVFEDDDLVDEDVFDDPYDVVMYDIDVDDDDVHGLIKMLSDAARSWYASRRLDSLAASGELQYLVAAVIIDSLGRRWNPLLHPRDRFGRFIETGGFFRWMMNGAWHRGRVDRIDSDGVIHARSFGNDRIPDGSPIRFKASQTSKLVSINAPNADLSIVNVDEDVPDFPEASPTQRRVWNALALGDMPAEDLYAYRVEADGTRDPRSFSSQLGDLQSRGLVIIEDDAGGIPRVRRRDNDNLNVVDIDDNDIEDVPEGEVPELSDSPSLSVSQRRLYDQIIEADRGEGDGVGFDEITVENEDDIQALVDAGLLERAEYDRLYAINPEGDAPEGDVPEGDVPEDATPEPDTNLLDEIWEAAQGRMGGDVEMEEAFQYYAERLAFPDEDHEDEDSLDLPQAKRRNARAQAERWWEERNAGTPDADAESEDTPTPEPSSNDDDVLNPRNQALADMLAADWFPDEYLDSAEGEQYRRALKRLFDAEDREEAGDLEGAERDRARAAAAIRRLDAVAARDAIEGWPLVVREFREEDRDNQAGEADADVDAPESVDAPEADVDVPEAPEIADEVPEANVDADVPDDVPSGEEVDAPGFGMNNLDLWVDWQKRVDDERDLDGDLNDALLKESEVANDMGLNLFAGDGLVNWNAFVQDIDPNVAEALYRAHNGNVNPAAMDYIVNKERWDNLNAPDDGAIEDVLNDEERDLLSRINGGGQARRSERSLEDDLFERGYLEEDENGDSRLTDAGLRALGDENVAEEVVPDDVAEEVVPDDVAEEVVPDDVAEEVVPDDVAPDEAPNGRYDEPFTQVVADSARLYPDSTSGRLVFATEARALFHENNGDHDTAAATRSSNIRRRFRKDYGDDAFETLTDDARRYMEGETLTPRPNWPQRLDSPAPTTNDIVDDVAPEVDVTPEGDPALSVDVAPDLPDPANSGQDTPGFKWISGAGGLNAGGVYELTEDIGPFKTGERVYIKNGRSPEHAQNELLANRLYKLAGADVPDLYLGSSNDRLASRMIDGLHDLNIHNPDDAEALNKIRDQFALDAWIANWDGMNPGNTLITADGTPYRIDVGSAMEYRAQGGLKGSFFGEEVRDIDTLRDPSMNYDTGVVYGPMSDDQVKASVERLKDINPEDIRSTILGSNLPDDDKNALADKMLARRSNLLESFDIADPFAEGSDVDVDAEPDTSTSTGDNEALPNVPAPTKAQTKAAQTKVSQAVQKRRDDFANRTNPYLEPVYDDFGSLIMADGTPLDFDAFYHTAAGGEGKHGQVVEVLDQNKFPGFVKLRMLDGSERVRHVLGTGQGKGGLITSSTDVVEDSALQEQALVQGGKKIDPPNPDDFPMADGNSPISGTHIIFDVGGVEQRGVLMYFDPRYDDGGRAYIIPEGGGKNLARPVRLIRAQTDDERDMDAIPLVPYEQAAVPQQYMPAPRFNAQGVLLDREDVAINIGDWLGQRAGGDGLVGEVIDIPDQNLYPGWVTLRFPDGEVRSRHVEGFTEVGKTRGSGGLRHVVEPDPNTWTRQRRVEGEAGDVLDYDFSNLKTLDDTEIQVGQEVFGTDRTGQSVYGLLIRINPFVQRKGQTVPTGYVWQNGREVTVDVANITNTRPATVPSTARVTSFTSPATPSNVRPTTRPRPNISSSNTAPAYTPNKGIELSDADIEGLDTSYGRLATSDRTEGNQPYLAAVYESQDFDALPLVVDQQEYLRLVREEGYVPIVRGMYDYSNSFAYSDRFKHGKYYAGVGIHGDGTYFAYGNSALQQANDYGSDLIMGLIRPEDANLISKDDLYNEWRAELKRLSDLIATTDDETEEFASIRRRYDLYRRDMGVYAAAKGYDGLIVEDGNSHRDGSSRSDPTMSTWGFLVLYNRSAIVAVDEIFPTHPDPFLTGFENVVASPSVPGVV